MLLRLGFDPCVAYGEVAPGMQETTTLMAMLMCVSFDVAIMTELFNGLPLERLKSTIEQYMSWGHPDKTVFWGKELQKFLQAKGFAKRRKEED